jgi:hypothetical protein
MSDSDRSSLRHVERDRRGSGRPRKDPCRGVTDGLCVTTTKAVAATE